MRAFAVHQLLELFKGSKVAGRQHVDRHTRGVRELHRLGGKLERVDSRFLDQIDWRFQVTRIGVERAEEDEHVVGARAANEIALWNRASVAWRQEQELPALALIRPGKTDVAGKSAAVDRNRPLPEIQQDALKHRRCIEHERPVLAQIHVSHRIDHVRVRRSHQRLGIKALLPDGQHVVALAEGLLRASLHAERVNERQCPQICLRGALVEQFVAECPRRFRRGSIFHERQVGDLRLVLDGRRRAGFRLVVLGDCCRPGTVNGGTAQGECEYR